MSDLFDLGGKVAIVTGSSLGIGRATAEAMAAHGAKVVISSRKPEKCETVAEGIKKKRWRRNGHSLPLFTQGSTSKSRE